MFSHINPSNYSQQLEDKKKKITTLFSSYTLPAIDVFESEPIHYRYRAEFRVWHDDDDLYYVMFDSKTKQKYKVDYFPVASLLINECMARLLVEIKDNTLLRNRLFQVDFLSSKSSEVVISLLYHKQLCEEWIIEAEKLVVTLSSIAKINIIGRARKQKVILHKDYLMEHLKVGNNTYHYQQVENSFTQPNASINEKMLLWAQQATVNASGDLIELYCGNGNFSIALAENFDRVLGTEISKSSVKSAQVNIAENKLDNIKIVRMSSEEFSQAINGERQFRRLEGLNLTNYNYDTVLVDPPRAGLDPQSLELISRFNKVIYISCNPTTLNGNLSELIKTHKIDNFALFDQFPYTDHVEVGVILSLM